MPADRFVGLHLGLPHRQGAHHETRPAVHGVRAGADDARGTVNVFFGFCVTVFYSTTRQPCHVSYLVPKLIGADDARGTVNVFLGFGLLWSTATTRQPCDVPYLVPMLIGAWESDGMTNSWQIQEPDVRGAIFCLFG